MSTKSHLTNLLKAGYGGIYITSYEEDRVCGELLTVAKEINYTPWFWSITTGLACGEHGPDSKLADPLKMLDKFISDSDGNNAEKALYILRDFHAYFRGNPAPILVRRFKEAIQHGRASNRHLIILGCALHLPPELEKEIVVVEFALPSKEELKEVANQIAESAGQELNGNTEPILDAGSGLTTTEFADACAYAVAETKSIDAGVIARIKADTLKKGGILEIIKPGVTFNDIGGLDELKSWISKRKHAFSKKAIEYGLPAPKGVLLYGVQGAGKSYSTRAIASELECPLLKLDAGKLFGGVVGESERNTRAVIAQVEAFGKCVLQIEELDKSFAGMVGGHDGDSGTTRRVIGTFLTWMQEKTAPVFIVATANDLTKLPAEMLRKGRWDELFFIDLPTTKEREEIWKVQIKKHGRNPEDFDIEYLAVDTEGWTGAEIEALFKEALYYAFDLDVEPTNQHLLKLMPLTKPLSETMAESVKALRDWSQGRARAASGIEAPKKQSLKRKIA